MTEISQDQIIELLPLSDYELVLLTLDKLKEIAAQIELNEELKCHTHA